MSDHKEKVENGDRVQDFYEGKSIFLTGASGFLGTVLLEILLRCLPGIANIYILLRAKQDTIPEKRKEIVFKKKVFRTLLKDNPDVVNKVTVIPGDIQKSNLGMSDEDIQKMIPEVSIIFHVAAVISFFKPLRYSVINNSLATMNVIEFARKLHKLDVLVYTSSAYSNSNRSVIEESIYRLPFPADRFLAALKDDDCELENLKKECKPDFPNNYTFSKCLSENILNDAAKDLPVAIIRPSTIGACWLEPFRGYVEEGSGMVEISMAMGKGFGKVLYLDPEQRFDLIPVDISSNCHIIAAWAVGTKKLQSPLTVNNAGGPFYVTYGMFIKELMSLTDDKVLPKSFTQPSCVVTKNRLLYNILVVYEHYLPAYCIDLLLKLKGSKFSTVKMYKFMDRVVGEVKYFAENSFVFKMEKYSELSNIMDPRDKKIFSLNLEEVNFPKIIRSIPDATEFFDFTNDRLTLEKRKEIMIRRTRIISCLKITTVLLLCYLLYRFLCWFSDN